MQYHRTINGLYFFITSCNLIKSISVSSFAKKNHIGGFLAYLFDNLINNKLMNKSTLQHSKPYTDRSGIIVQLPAGAQLSCVANTCGSWGHHLFKNLYYKMRYTSIRLDSSCTHLCRFDSVRCR